MTKAASTPMHRLIFLRHAKSAWPDGVADHDRPLAKRGEKAAPLIGAYMAREGLIPDLVLVSTAKRAQQTWALVRHALPPPGIGSSDVAGLYGADGKKMLEIVRAVTAPARTLMLVGHNPGTGEAVQLVSGSGEPEALARVTEKYPTAGLAVIAFDIEQWRDVGPLEGYLERFVTPDTLG